MKVVWKLGFTFAVLSEGWKASGNVKILRSCTILKWSVIFQMWLKTIDYKWFENSYWFILIYKAFSCIIPEWDEVSRKLYDHMLVLWCLGGMAISLLSAIFISLSVITTSFGQHKLLQFNLSVTFKILSYFPVSLALIESLLKYNWL